MGATNDGNSFSGGDGKFSYKNALKAKRGQRSKKLLNLGPTEGFSLSPLLEGFPPLGFKDPGPIIESTTAVAAVVAVEDWEKEVDMEESKTVHGGKEDVEIEEEYEKNDGDSSKIIGDSREGNLYDDEEEEIKEGEEEEDDDDDNNDDDSKEDDITRYQREIEEQHKLKEGQGLRPALTTQIMNSSFEAMDDLLISSLLKVRACKYNICCSLCNAIWINFPVSLSLHPISLYHAPFHRLMFLSYYILSHFILFQLFFTCCIVLSSLLFLIF